MGPVDKWVNDPIALGIPMFVRPTIPVLFVLTLLCGCATTSKHNAAAPSTDASNVAALLAKGREAAARGDAVRAEQYLSLAIKRGADKGEVLPVLLRSCLRSSHLRAALNHAQPYLLEHPEDDALRFLVATIHVGLGQRAAARRELELLLDRSPRDPDGHYLLGILDADFDAPAAKSHFEAAIKDTKDEDQRVEVQSRLAELRLSERRRVESAP